MMDGTTRGLLIVLAVLVVVGVLAWLGSRREDKDQSMTEAKSPAQDWLMKYRPVSQMLKIIVLPELEKRVASGVISPDMLPVQVHKLRLVNPGLGCRVEFNEEANLELKVATKRPLKAGEPVMLDDIDPEKCFLKAPLVDGHPASYFLVQSAFLDLQVMFDFTQNAPGTPPILEPAPAMRYDIAGFVRAWEFLKIIRPLEKFRQFSDHNWPPAPGYFPSVLAFAHRSPGLEQEPAFADAVASAYNADLWAQRMAFWTEAKFFPGRLQYVQKAIDEYQEGDWISSTYVLVPQFEGIIQEYLSSSSVTPGSSFAVQIGQLRSLILSRNLLMFPLQVLELILGFLETGTFWRNTSKIGDPMQEVNRHGIAHGVFTGFESRDIALKHLILLDGLAFLLLHDKVLTNRLS